MVYKMINQENEKVSVEAFQTQDIGDIITDQHLTDEPVDDVIKNKYIIGSIDTIVTAELNSSIYEFIYQASEFGFGLYSDNGRDENVVRYINDKYNIDRDNDDFDNKIIELENRYIEKAQEAFDEKLEEIKLDLQNA